MPKLYPVTHVTGTPFQQAGNLLPTTIAAMTVGAIMISFSGVWVALAQVPATVSAFYRVFFGGIFLLAAAGWRRELKWKGLPNLGLGVLCGFIFAINLISYHIAIITIGPGLATMISNCQVFFLAAAGIIWFGEQVSYKYWMAVPLAMVGLFLIIGFSSGPLGKGYQTGLVVSFSTAVSYSVFLLTLRRLQAGQVGISIFYILMLVSLTTSVFIGAEILLTGGSFAIPDFGSGLSLFMLGLLSQAAGWVLITNALPRIRASLAGLLLLLQPALAFVWDVLLFDRLTTLTNWIGVAVVLMAIYLGITRKVKEA